MKFKLLATIATLFFSSLSHTAPINYECEGTPNPNTQDCPNDPLLTESYEMDFMNFSYAWDKSYGTARVAIIDTLTHLFTLDQGPSKLRSHDSGQYACVNSSTTVYRYAQNSNTCEDRDFDVFYPYIHDIAAGYSRSRPERHGDMILSLFASNADDDKGMSSICRNCSLAYYGYDAVSPEIGDPNGPSFLDRAYYMNSKFSRGYQAISNAINSGNQIINLSGYFSPSGTAASATFPNCDKQLTKGFQQNLCNALKTAKELDTVFVASTGNNPSHGPNWPAKEEEFVIGVGGSDINGDIWEESSCPFSNSTEECGSQNFGSGTTITAPAKSVTTYHHEGSFNVPIGCIDHDGTGYTKCTGTSFSAPIISGVIAIMRSLNPLLSFDEVKDLLATSRVYSDTQGRTYSIPNVASIIKKKVLGFSNGLKVKNKLKPMFRLHHNYNYQGEAKVDYLSTSIPQVAAAAWRRQYFSEVQPKTGHLKSGEKYRTDNAEPLAIGYPRFRQPNMELYGDNARAPFYIFGGHKNPFTGADDMIPLYHFALQTVDTNDPRCFDQADHAYGTFHLSAFTQRVNVRCNYGVDTRYVKEGIEGYLLPSCPEGTNGCYENTGNAQGPQCLMLRFSNEDNSYALLMQSELNKMKFSTYTHKADHLMLMDDAECLGYVYPNVDSDDDLVLDGMEAILGTNPNDTDSDNDGMTDGQEYPPASPVVSDPLIAN